MRRTELNLNQLMEEEKEVYKKAKDDAELGKIITKELRKKFGARLVSIREYGNSR